MKKLKVIVFEGVQNLPIFAAQAQSFFQHENLDIDLTFTPNSWTLRDGLKDGLYDIAHTAVDNAVAMVDTANADVAVFMGGDNGFNGLFVQPEIKSIADLRAKTVLVDAPNTAFALALYKILSLEGMELDAKDYEALSIGATPFRLKAMQENKSYAGAIMNLPFRLQAIKSGLVHLGDLVDILGPYLSTAGFVMRGWAQQHEIGRLYLCLCQGTPLGFRSCKQDSSDRFASGQVEVRSRCGYRFGGDGHITTRRIDRGCAH